MSPIPESLPTLTAALTEGRKGPLAAALAGIEREPFSPESCALLDDAFAHPRGCAIGLTGPPGVGKSTLLGALIAAYRGQGRSVGVIAVDPSSKVSGGALLGDRTRIVADPDDAGVFIRSMAARDRLGGLAALTFSGLVLMRALYDVVLVETVGVGQSETDISGVVDTVLFCVQPGAGDALQYMKAGIIEIPHVVAVTKADMGDAAARAARDVEAALHLGNAQVPVLTVSAAGGLGIAELTAALDRHGTGLQDIAERRRTQATAWMGQTLREAFGTEGLRSLQKRHGVGMGIKAKPFAETAGLFQELMGRFGG